MRLWKLSTGFVAALAGCAIVVGLWPNAQSSNFKGASRHIAVTANPYASSAALQILRQGGSAVDAAISAELALTLVEPQSSGIGGGLFMLVSDSTGKMTAFDGREAAPSRFSPRAFIDHAGRAKKSHEVATGGMPVGVPGAVAAMWSAHKRYGRLSWKQLFEPAIALAEKGFVVTPLLARAIRELPQDSLDSSMKRIYFQPDGRRIRAGQIITDPEYARTLRIISERGVVGFYEGEVAEAIVAAVSAAPNAGVMTLSDLAGYSAREREPLCSFYRAYRICTTPAPSGGPTVLQILGILSWFNSDILTTGSFSQAHYFTQASRLAYADRAQWLADPEHVSVPQSALIDTGYLATRADSIEPDRDMGTAEAGKPPSRHALVDFAPQRTPVGHGTSHLSIVDSHGLIVSMTASIQASFGAQIRAAGFVLNNELTDFSLEPTIEGRAVANAPGPGKRPLSAMSPSIVFGKSGFFAAIGSPGGPDIISYNAQALVDLIDGENPIERVAANPHFANLNGSTVLEAKISTLLLIPRLLMAGHTVRLRKLESGLNGIHKAGTNYSGATDVRGEGAAQGE